MKYIVFFVISKKTIYLHITTWSVGGGGTIVNSAPNNYWVDVIFPYLGTKNITVTCNDICTGNTTSDNAQIFIN